MSDAHKTACAPVIVTGEVDRFRIDELLELLWYAEEKELEPATAKFEELLGRSDPEPKRVLESAVERGLVRIEAERTVWTDEGRARARGIVRRHRLAEILFSQVLEVEEGEVESSACEMEHILSSGVTDSVCAFLGHPPRCPHGREIPPGECCRTFSRQVAPLVGPLAELDPGNDGDIVFISSRVADRLERLADLGVVPGVAAKLVQKNPSYVISIGETTLALEREIVREIYVRRTV